jgi:hypothetical protein
MFTWSRFPTREPVIKFYLNCGESQGPNLGRLTAANKLYDFERSASRDGGGRPTSPPQNYLVHLDCDPAGVELQKDEQLLYCQTSRRLANLSVHNNLHKFCSGYLHGVIEGPFDTPF